MSLVSTDQRALGVRPKSASGRLILSRNGMESSPSGLAVSTTCHPDPVLIRGNDHGPLVPGEPLLDRGGFWANHLLAMCSLTFEGERWDPEWFGDDSADTDALSEVLFDDRSWPVFRIPFDAGHTFLIVYRNFVGDYGIDYLLIHPAWSRAEVVASFDGDWSGPGFSWRDLTYISGTPEQVAVGVQDPACRLLLLLPVLVEAELPADATAVVHGALVAVGVPSDIAQETAERLLEGRRCASWQVGVAGSPLSGGPDPTAAGEPESAILSALNITRAQGGLLARALGSSLNS
ncbi:hypothetical protein ACIRD3_34190 [Kitasatospora sp. NPDC093550]|uniref:hypothetical protein n=1 Tax=Kitasatospora sp. NPDC093550 TaxID=3364089 RepID=UPI00381EA932